MTGSAPSGSWSPPAPLVTALERLRLDGAVFFRAEFTEPWSFTSPLREITSVLHPGATRMILFHVVAQGRCWVSLPGGDRHWARGGDVIVLPYGDDYLMGGVEAAQTVPILSLITRPPWTTMPVVAHGAGGGRTDLVCGHLRSDDALFDPAMAALPPVFVVRLTDTPAAHWVEASIRYALASSNPSAAVSTSTRLPELLLIEVLRVHLASTPSSQHGWIAALRDPVLAPAMAQLHAAPNRKWTVAELASASAVSRSVLDERFRRILGRSPIRYLTEWRMHVAADLFATTDLNVATIARRVGYESEEAFSRAFKRSHGSPPGAWRSLHHT
jgi:AraC-like DNA-binding protein